MYSQGKMRIITYDIQVVKIDIYLQTGKYFYCISRRHCFTYVHETFFSLNCYIYLF